MEESSNRLEELKKRLYSRTQKIKNPTMKQSGTHKSFDISEDWETTYKNEPEDTSNMVLLRDQDMPRKKQHSFLNKALVLAGLFFLAAVLYALFSFSTGQGVISSDNIEIKVSGPISVSAGEILSLQLDIRNKNNVELEYVDLLVEYPEGTRDPKDLSKELKRSRIPLGNIDSGKKIDQIIESVLFGEEGDRKEISIGIEYRVPGSNAIFFADRTYEVEIVSSPITMNVESATSVNSGELMEFVVTITPNSSEGIGKTLLVAEYPFGFEYVESSIEPTYDDNVWEISGIKAGQKQRIVITGRMVGQNNEERTFRFTVGLPKEFDEKIIGTPFLTHSRSITIEKSFLGMSIALNGSTAEDSVASINSQIRGDISWQNNLSSRVDNVVLELSLKGDMLNKLSVSSGSGFFRSTDDTIVWDERSIKGFSSIGARESGSTSFSFKSLDVSKIAGLLKDPKITLTAKITGTSFNDDGVPEKITTTMVKYITISTEINLSASAKYFSGPFINNGPLPPKANSETTYTVTLSASNAINKVTGTRVTATLPAYARWMGVVSPSNEKITYNAIGGQIVWDIGDLESGVGYSNPSREVSFQIAITPSTSQIGASPELIQNPHIEARDTVTDKQLSRDVSRNVTTNIQNDPGFKTDFAFVVGE